MASSISPTPFPSSTRTSDQSHKQNHITTTKPKFNHRSTYSSYQFSHSLSQNLSILPLFVDVKTTTKTLTKTMTKTLADGTRYYKTMLKTLLSGSMTIWPVFVTINSKTKTIHLLTWQLMKIGIGNSGINILFKLMNKSVSFRYWRYFSYGFKIFDFNCDNVLKFWLQLQLKHAVDKEDYEDAVRIKVAIEAASTHDTVGRVMSQLNVRKLCNIF